MLYCCGTANNFTILKKILFILLFFSCKLTAQDDTSSALRDDVSEAVISDNNPSPGKMYRIKKGIDIPIVLGGFAWTGYAFSVIYTKKATPVSDILNLDKSKVPSFDRWNAGWHDGNMDKISYYPFYAVMPLPLVLLFDKSISKNAGSVGLLYLEAFSFTGIVYSSSVFFIDRYRPDVYNTDLELSYRTNGNFRNSFFAGHVAVVATSTFFISKVYDDYHPHSKFKWVLYGASTAATLGMAYMRLEAGKHFTSDVITGIVVGVGSALLTPELHKNRDRKNQKWSLSPTLGSQNGFVFTCKL
jgi:membrane-associated phospholipid phosphatase